MPGEQRVEALAAELRALGAATLGESGASPMALRVRAIWPGARLAAPALPVSCVPGDNLALHAAVAGAARGTAPVVSVGPTRARGYWGEVLTTAASSRGVAGLVIDGGVRDVAAIQALAFPVFATAVSLPGATKTQGGSVGRTVEVGGVDVEPGDWVVGDDDGVVVLASAELDAIVARAQDRAARERELFDRLRAGATTIELLGLDTGSVERA